MCCAGIIIARWSGTTDPYLKAEFFPKIGLMVVKVLGKYSSLPPPLTLLYRNLPLLLARARLLSLRQRLQLALSRNEFARFYRYYASQVREKGVNRYTQMSFSLIE